MAETRKWQIFWWLAWSIWALLFAVVLIFYLYTGKVRPQNNSDEIAPVVMVLVVIAFATMFVLGLVALLRRETRIRLLNLPIAAATSVYAASLLAAMLLFLITAIVGISNPLPSLFDSFHPVKILSDIGYFVAYEITFTIFGLMLFAFSFGLMLPATITMLCTFTVYLLVRRRGRISKAAWCGTLGLSLAGWYTLLAISSHLGLGG